MYERAIIAGVVARERILILMAPQHLLALAAVGTAGVNGNAIAARVRLRGARRPDGRALTADGHRAGSDAVLSLSVTALIVRITWQSWRIVGGYDHRD
jgi:divalent metal cation (Fe/Co/Zn/Cd) transporter